MGRSTLNSYPTELPARRKSRGLIYSRRKMRLLRFAYLSAAVVAVLLASCGGPADQPTPTEPPSPRGRAALAEPNAAPDGDSDAYPHGYAHARSTDGDSHPHANGSAHGYTHADSHAVANSHSHADSHAIAYPNRHKRTYGHAYGYGHAHSYAHADLGRGRRGPHLPDHPMVR